MTTAVALGIGALLGGLLATLVLGVRQALLYTRERRNLASALIGEVVAVVLAMENDPVVREIEAVQALGSDGGGHQLRLPQPAIYEGAAAKLDRFNVPIPRKIAHFFEGLPSVVSEIGNVAGAEGTEASPSRMQQLRSVLKNTFEEADDILLAIRAIVAPHNKARHIG